MLILRRNGLLAICLFLLGACSKKGGNPTEPSPTPPGAGSATSAASSQSAPADVPTFLDRFCAAVSSGDKAYVVAHTENGTFSSDQATDPKKCGGRTGKRCFRKTGGQHAEADFRPVCTRVQTQLRADLAKSVREEGGTLRARLSEGDLVSDLVIERQGKDFRLLREVAPGKP